MKASIKAFAQKKKDERKNQKSNEASTIGMVSPHPEININDNNQILPLDDHQMNDPSASKTIDDRTFNP
jgi:hypothetical protein